MATRVSEAQSRGFHGFWVVLLTAVAILAVTGVGLAAGRNSAGSTPAATGQSNPGPQVTHLMPWMQAHVGDIAWMQQHMGDVAWMRGHWNRWQWMQAHPGYVRWMQTHPAQRACLRDQNHNPAAATIPTRSPSCPTSATCTTTGVSGPGGGRA